MSIALRFAARSDVGLLRSGNEDSAYAGPRLLAVADGVGGAVAGEVASSIVIATLAPLDDDPPGPDLLDRLAHTVTDANAQLRMMIRGDSSLEGMGTTLTALLRAGNKLGLVHVGDSRGYLLRDGELCQITKDHSWVQALVDDGRISAEEALQHPQRSLILRVLDGREDTALDLSVREARTGDRYLLCSDGVTDVVRDETVREALATSESPGEACERLVDLALRAGGPDNITCVVADVVDVDAAPPAYPEVVGAASASSAPRRTGGDSAAVKAAALGAGATAAAPPASPSRKAPDQGRAGRVFRRGVVLLVLIAVLAGSAGAAYAWSQRQYYVGRDGEVVAIYRGIDQRLAGVALSELHERTPLRLADLPDFARRKVADGTIAATDLDDARRIVSGLGDQAAACRQGASSPTTGASGTASSSATPTAASTPAGTASPGTTPASTSTPGTTTPGTTTAGTTAAPASPSSSAPTTPPPTVPTCVEATP